MKLYYCPGSCSLAVHIALCETNLEYTIEKVDLKTKLTETGANFFEINLRGQVPALQLDDGAILCEVSAILQYIAAQAPEEKLLPETGTFERFKALEWLSYLSSEVHKSFAPLFLPDLPESYKEVGLKKIHNNFSYLNKLLTKQDYLLGKEFTLPDMYLYVMLCWPAFVGHDISEYKSLTAFIQRVGKRTSVRRARLEEGLSEYSTLSE